MFNFLRARREQRKDGLSVDLMGATYFQWSLALDAGAKERPEAAAVLMGIFDCIGQRAGWNEAQTAGAMAAVLGSPEGSVRGAHPELTAGILFDRMLAASGEPTLAPWMQYGGAVLARALTDAAARQDGDEKAWPVTALRIEHDEVRDDE
jgi:hypothetical protein